jgi:hypothetical protein
LAVWLDLEERCLNLHQVSLSPKTRKVKFGSGTSVNFAQITDIALNSGVLEILGPRGVTLARLHLETTEELQMWSSGLRDVLRSNAASVTEVDEADNSLDATCAPSTELLDTLKALVVEQERRLAKLEEITTAKDAQLLKLHSHLEESLGILQHGQKTYAEQQKVVEAQQTTIGNLRKEAESRVLPVSSTAPSAAVPEAPVTSARATAAFAVAAAAAARVAAAAPKPAPTEHRSAPRDEQDDDAIIEQDSQMSALLQRTEELQRAASEAAASAAAQTGGAAQPAIMAKLTALIKEKDDLEAQLRKEQAELEAELRSLHASKQ